MIASSNIPRSLYLNIDDMLTVFTFVRGIGREKGVHIHAIAEDNVSSVGDFIRCEAT